MKNLLRFSPWMMAAALSVLTISAPGQAQEIRIGYVNTDRILKESNYSKLAKTKLEQEFGKRTKDLDERDVALKAFADKFDRESPAWSEAVRAARQKEFAEMKREFDRRQREYREDAASRQNEEFQQVLERANRAVRQIAETERYDIVLQEAVYFNPKYDITDKVIKALNALPAGK